MVRKRETLVSKIIHVWQTYPTIIRNHAWVADEKDDYVSHALRKTADELEQALNEIKTMLEGKCYECNH